MNTLTKEQIELLKNEDVKAIAELYAKNLYSFDSFASQFEDKKEWKILKYNVCGSIMPTERVNTPDSYPIHSVQYKSETLTVGDDTDKGKIKSFRVNSENKMQIHFHHSDLAPALGWCFISEVKKIERKARFVTNGDGEEIFDDDICYFIHSDKLIVEYDFGWKLAGNISGATYFKSKEKATEFILLNSPKLSVKEVMKVVTDCGTITFIETELIELIKSKTQ